MDHTDDVLKEFLKLLELPQCKHPKHGGFLLLSENEFCQFKLKGHMSSDLIRYRTALRKRTKYEESGVLTRLHEVIIYSTCLICCNSTG